MSPEQLFDNSLAIVKRARASAMAVADADFLLTRVASDLQERLSVVGRDFPLAVSLFVSTSIAARVLEASGKVGTIVRIEDDSSLVRSDYPVIVSAPDELPLSSASVNLAVSLLAMHRFNDLPGFLAQVRRSLKPDGLFLAALPGAGTLAELRESLIAAEAEIRGGASNRVMPFAEVRQLGALLQRAGFTLPVADIETVTVRYDTMFDLIRDLRAMGATNTLRQRSRQTGNRALFMRAAEIYAERHADPDGRLRATFSIVWLSGWAPHESQQKPARRGSASASLADVLKKF